MIKRIINLPLAVGSYTVGFAVVMAHLALAGRAERRLQLASPPHDR
jgi:hypothetical protein